MYVMPRDAGTKSGFRAAYNRLNLLKHAAGDYLGFLDGDDCLTNTNKLEAQIEVLNGRQFEGCSCCGQDITIVYKESGSTKSLNGNQLKEGVIKGKEYWLHYYVHTNTILFRANCKEYLMNCKYNYNFNDNYITFLLLQCGDMYYMPMSMAQYNITGTGIWTGNTKLYGYTRNLLALDAEVKINPEWREESLCRHLSDLDVVAKGIDKGDQAVISGLLPYMSMEETPYSYLIVCKNRLTKEQFAMRKKLMRSIRKRMLALRLSRIPHHFREIFHTMAAQSSQ